MSVVRQALTLWTASSILELGMAFELQDTIHTLIEENIHLHEQLENLKRALHDLKLLLRRNPQDTGGEHDPEIQHLWEEWKEHGISAETHLLLEQALCGHDLPGAANPVQAHTLLLFTSLFYHSLLT